MSKVKYRKRVPKVLVDILNRNEITKVCTVTEVKKIDELIDKSKDIMEMDLDYKYKFELASSILEPYIIKVRNKTINKKLTYDEAVKFYLNYTSKYIAKDEFECKRYFFVDLFSKILAYVFKENPLIDEIDAIHLNKAKNIIMNLPSRNKKMYRKFTINELIRKVDTKEIVIPSIDRLSIRTVNKHLKRITSLSNFGKDSGLFNLISCKLAIQNKYKSFRSYRFALSKTEIRNILNIDNKDEKVSLLIRLSFFSGLRLSEIPKAKIKFENNMYFFDLTDKNMKLKTASSYRKVPIHNELIPYLPIINEFKYNELQWLARKVKNVINKTLDNSTSKSLYSLRHSFATELIANNINPAIVSELMGHSQNSLTLSVYTKEFPISMLKESINSLNIDDKSMDSNY